MDRLGTSSSRDPKMASQGDKSFNCSNFVRLNISLEFHHMIGLGDSSYYSHIHEKSYLKRMRHSYWTRYNLFHRLLCQG